MAKEINLVPDIKAEMIKTLKLRNLIFFVCIVASIAAVAAVVILGSIMGGQQLVMEDRKNTINELSNKLNADTDLSKYLTIQSQLDQLSEIDHEAPVNRGDREHEQHSQSAQHRRQREPQEGYDEL